MLKILHNWLTFVQSTMQFLVVRIVLLAVVTGCAPPNLATGQYFQDVLHPNSDEALVYFYRSPRPEAPKNPWTVVAQAKYPGTVVGDYKDIGRLDYGGYFVYRTPPGRYRFALKGNPDFYDIWLDLKGGQTVFFTWSNDSYFTPFTARERFLHKPILVDELQGLNDLRGCRLMQAAQ